MHGTFLYAAQILALLANSAGWAPVDTAAGFLTIPETAELRCRSERVVVPARAWRVEMEIGRPPATVTRFLRATYDSAGRPLELTDQVTILDREHSIRMYTATGRFVHDTLVGFIVTHGRSWQRPGDRIHPTPKDSLRGKYAPMTPFDDRRVRALAAWLWARRCPISPDRRKPA